MAVTKIDIASRALIMIGSNPISSFTDDTTEALVTNNIYEEIIESTLCRSRWRFATEQQQLSLLANAPTGRYEYAYQIPTSPQCLQIISITENDINILSCSCIMLRTQVLASYLWSCEIAISKGTSLFVLALRTFKSCESSCG